MRLLLLLQGRSPADQPGYHQAFVDLQARGVIEAYHCLPYLPPGPEASPDPAHWPALYRRALQIIADEAIDVLMLQWFHGPLEDPRPFLTEARRLRPHLQVVTTGGDPYGRWLQRPPPSLFQAASLSDLCFLTSMGYMADALIARGARNVVLMPNGACQLRFSAPVVPAAPPAFDVVFIGSHNGGRNPFTRLSRSGRQRAEMVRQLTRRYGRRFGLFGRNWADQPAWQGPVAYAEQHRAAAQGRLQLGGFPGSMAPYYTSDRFYIAMASGVPLLDFRVPRVDRLATPDVHWRAYDSVNSLLKAVDRTLDQPPETLQDWGRRARDYVLGAHTQAHRTHEMVDIIQALREARRLGRPLPPPRLRCFAPGVDPEAEAPLAVRGWTG